MSNREMTYSENDIRVLTKLEWLNAIMDSQLEIDPVYVLLGAINSYYGPIGNSPGDIVEFFETDKLEKMKPLNAVCQYILKTRQLENDIEIIQEGNFNKVLSKQISTILKQHLILKKTIFNRNYYQFSQDDSLFNTPKKKFLNSKQCSFLIGVGIGGNRFENKLKFVIDYKAELTIDFLKRIRGFGANHITAQYNFDGYTEVNISQESLFWNIIDDYIEKIILHATNAKQ